MNQPKYQIIAAIAGILTIMAISSLVLRVHITKDAEHLTYTWIFLVLMAQSMLVIYGLINNLYGIYIPSTILILGVSYVLYVKIVYLNTTKIEDELRIKHILMN